MNECCQIAVEELSLGYSKKPLVANININIEEGDFWAVAGANGQGKSTFIKAIMGLIAPLSGKIKYTTLKKSEIGYIPQSNSQQLALPMTAAEFIALSAPGHFFSEKRKQAIKEALEQVWLWDKKDRAYNTLSGGEKQRLHIARALVRKPKLLILDEPDNGLDFTAIGNLTDLLEDLNTKQKMSILLISHNLITAQKMTQKTILFCNGTVKIGDSKSILSKENIIEAFPIQGNSQLSVSKWLENT